MFSLILIWEIRSYYLPLPQNWIWKIFSPLVLFRLIQIIQSEDFILDLNKFRTIESIGEGQFGKVYLVEEKRTGKYFAAKVHKKGFISNTLIKEFNEIHESINNEIHNNSENLMQIQDSISKLNELFNYIKDFNKNIRQISVKWSVGKTEEVELKTLGKTLCSLASPSKEEFWKD